MRQYNASRRVPHSIPEIFLWRALLPLAGPALKNVAVNTVSKVAQVGGPPLREAWEEKARQTGDDAVQKAQSTYFDEPGLDSLTVRVLSKVGRLTGHMGALYLRARITFGLDRDGRAKKNLPLIPRTGYDSLMVGGLVAGRTLGFFKPGKLRYHLWWDGSKAEGDRLNIPQGHPKPLIRRFEPPRSLGDVAADIDDMYWAGSWGQPIKVVRVGNADNRRWIVTVPGTDHGGFESEPNPADLEANFEEELNITSDVRAGVIRVVRHAMGLHGLSEEQMVKERVLVGGHSQGGMVAAALAAAAPEAVGFTVDGVLTMGSPTRRLTLRSDVHMVAVEHLQDIVPSLDGVPRRDMDQRVTYTRSLTKPRMDPLFYAHSSATYTETVRQLESRARVVPWGRVSEVVEALQGYLPEEGEDTAVMHYYVWRDLDSTGEVDLSLDVGQPRDWRAVTFEGEVQIPEESRQLLKERIKRVKAK